MNTIRIVACLAAVLATASVVVPAYGQGGAIAASIERRIAKRIAQGAGAAAVTAAERQALARLWIELDRRSLTAIERRYGRTIGQERLRKAAESPAAVMQRSEFDSHLRRVSPELSESERGRILGFYFDRRVVVDGNQVQLPLTMAHERLHQLSHPRFRNRLGESLDEGVTEAFARNIYGDLAVRDAASVYLEERRVVSMLGARVGETRLAQAYFRGEIGVLEREIDSQLGRGSFMRLSQALRSGDIARAEAILR